MRLTIIAPENEYAHEVNSSMEVRDVKALIEAETAVPVSSQILTTDSGVVLTAMEKTLEDSGLKGPDATLFLTFSDAQPLASSSRSMAAGREDDFERMRLQILGDPRLMTQVQQNNPEFASAILQGGAQFRDMIRHQDQAMRDTAREKERQIEALNADPYDIEAQKKIEEAIRKEAVLENMQHAVDYSPEAFGHVTMLYINVEVNGHPVTAFVDSGAQSTIISPACAEACGIMRLMDERFAGVAEGVGTANILGRIHSAQIKLGSLFLPVSFSVLEGTSVDLLFGLDMLKRHQACIDLMTNTLRIDTTEIPFLSEHELPDKAIGRDNRAAPPAGTSLRDVLPAGGNSSSSTIPPPASQSAPSASQASAAPSAPSAPSGDIDTLVGLGASPEHAAQLLEAAGGNVDVAASMLFG